MPAPKTRLPKGVRFQTYVLKSTGEVVRYGYYGKGKDAVRGTFVTRRLAEGWNTMEVAICTGHSLRDLRMLDSYADRGKVAAAMARRVAYRLAENETETKTSK